MRQVYNSSTDVFSFGVTMWEILCGTAPYPETAVLSLAVEVVRSQRRPVLLQWFPRPLAILMQRCWQEIPQFRPSFEDIKNELELFEQELVANALIDATVVSMASSAGPPGPRSKERLRSLRDLVDEYLEPDRYHWDRLTRPKLVQLIAEYDEAHDPSMLLAQINTMHNERPSEMVLPPIEAALRKNVSLRAAARLSEAMDAKRISTELSLTPIRAPGTPGTVRFAAEPQGFPRHKASLEESRRVLPPLMSSDSMSLCHTADVSVSMNAADLMTLQPAQSNPVLSEFTPDLTDIVEAEKEPMDSPFAADSALTPYASAHGHVHALGDSVQIDIGSLPTDNGLMHSFHDL